MQMKRAAKTAALSILSLFCVQIYAQDLLDSVLDVGRLIDQEKYDEAYDALTRLEDKCVNSNKDSVKVLFYEDMGLLKFFRKEFTEAIRYCKFVPQLHERLNIRDCGYIESFLMLGMSYQRLGHDSIAEKYYRTGLLRTVNSKNTSKYQSSFYLNLGQIYKDKGDSILASECFKRIDPEQYGGLLDGKADFLIDDRESLALEMRKNGEFEQSLLVYDKLIEKVKEIIGTSNEEYARLLYSKALVLNYNLGRNKEAKPLFVELSEMRNILPEFNENVFYSMARFLQIAANEGDSLEVDSVFPSALSYAANSNNDTDICMLYRFVGNGYYWIDNYAQAIPYYEKYISLGKKETGLSYLEVPNMLAVCYLRTNSQDKAKDLLAELIGRYKVDIDQNPSLKYPILHNYGRAVMLGGQYKEAIEYFTLSNQTYKEITGKDNPKTQSYLEECKKHF
jgi:hypothetical protein